MSNQQPVRNQPNPVQNASVSTGRSAFWQAVGFAWDFGIVVVIPLVTLGILGRFLDRRLGTQPWLFLGSLLVSVVISTILVVIRLQSIIRRLTDQTKTKQQ